MSKDKVCSILSSARIPLSVYADLDEEQQKTALKNVMLGIVDKMAFPELEGQLKGVKWATLTKHSETMRLACRLWVQHPDCKLFLQQYNSHGLDAQKVKAFRSETVSKYELLTWPQIESMNSQELMASLRKLRQPVKGIQQELVNRLKFGQDQLVLLKYQEERCDQWLRSRFWTRRLTISREQSLRIKTLQNLRYPAVTTDLTGSNVSGKHSEFTKQEDKVLLKSLQLARSLLSKIYAKPDSMVEPPQTYQQMYDQMISDNIPEEVDISRAHVLHFAPRFTMDGVTPLWSLADDLNFSRQRVTLWQLVWQFGNLQGLNRNIGQIQGRYAELQTGNLTPRISKYQEPITLYNKLQLEALPEVPKYLKVQNGSDAIKAMDRYICEEADVVSLVSFLKQSHWKVYSLKNTNVVRKLALRCFYFPFQPLKRINTYQRSPAGLNNETISKAVESVKQSIQPYVSKSLLNQMIRSPASVSVMSQAENKIVQTLIDAKHNPDYQLTVWEEQTYAKTPYSFWTLVCNELSNKHDVVCQPKEVYDLYRSFGGIPKELLTKVRRQRRSRGSTGRDDSVYQSKSLAAKVAKLSLEKVLEVPPYNSWMLSQLPTNQLEQLQQDVFENFSILKVQKLLIPLEKKQLTLQQVGWDDDANFVDRRFSFWQRYPYKSKFVKRFGDSRQIDIEDLQQNLCDVLQMYGRYFSHTYALLLPQFPEALKNEEVQYELKRLQGLQNANINVQFTRHDKRLFWLLLSSKLQVCASSVTTTWRQVQKLDDQQTKLRRTIRQVRQPKNRTIDVSKLMSMF